VYQVINKNQQQKKDLSNMKLYQIIIGLLIVAVLGLLFNKYVAPKIPTENSYAQKFEYKENKRVKDLIYESETLRLKSLMLQAALDSCKYNITAFKTMTPAVRVVYKAKKSKALQDCEEEVIELRGHLGEYVGAKAQMEVEKDLQINLLKRQMDTCAYFVQEMDKALLKMSNDVTKLTNEKDSLANVLQTPIGITKEFPCLKAKKGTVVMASVIPATGEKDFTISNFNLPKDKYKAAKKSCRRTTR